MTMWVALDRMGMAKGLFNVMRKGAINEDDVIRCSFLYNLEFNLIET